MAGILQCEAGSSYEGMLAVGTVIMNRIASSKFPNTLKGVVYQKGQFTPASSGKLARVLAKGPNSSAYAAAKEVLGGKRHSKVKNCLYFNSASWTDHPGVNVGGNIFW
jgi:spore germination cell wall hydrolase CwlJ-like protein